MQNWKESWQNIPEKTRTLIKIIAGGTVVIALVAILALNLGKDKDYSTYGEDLDSRKSLIISEINNVISQRTMDEAKESNHIFEDEILEKIQTMFDSKFIYKVTITSAIYQ